MLKVLFENMSDPDSGVNLRPPPPLQISNKTKNICQIWKQWKNSFEWYAEATNLSKKSAKKQVATFMTVIGPEALEIYDSLELSDAEKKDLIVIIEKFEKYFIPKQNKTYERLLFNKMMQSQQQTFDEFLTLIINQVNKCQFGALKDELLCDKIVVGIINDEVRKKLLSEDELKYDKAVSICRAAELAEKHLSEMKISEQLQTLPVNEIRKNNIRSSSDHTTEKSNDNFFCRRCNSKHGKRACPAYGKKCQKCGVPGHFKETCRTRLRKVNTVSEDNENQNSSIRSSSEEDNIYVGSIQSNSCDKNDWIEKLILPKNKTVNFKLDTGAQADILTMDEVKKSKLILIKSKVKSLISYSNNRTPVIGETSVEIRTKRGQKVILKFLVVASGHQCIIGKNTCETLGLVKRVETIKYDRDLFTGIGCATSYVYDIDLIDNPSFKIFPPRKIPFSIRNAVKEELEKMVKNKIIAPMTEPAQAVSPMVVVWKNNKPRICIDLTDVNKNVRRRQFPLKTIEEVAVKLHNSSIFTKLDCAKGFWQIPVTDRTSKYLGIATPWGRYCSLRLPFGLASAPEVFQCWMSSLLGDLEGVEVAIDDILIHASCEAEMETITKTVLDRIKKAGLKLNPDKCIFNVPVVKFLGHIVSKHGLGIDENKMKAIDNLKIPQNVKELQRYIGMVTYLSKFINNLSELTAPLRKLLIKDVEWCWEAEHTQAVNKIKDAIKTAPILKHYNPNESITLSVDASKHSVGAVLLQGDRPVAFSSKALTTSQLNYSQIEKEATAILVGCKKYHSYIWGNPNLTIETDHKPLEAIAKKPLHCAPARLQRILFEIMPYCPKIKYKRGTDMVLADIFSRDAYSEIDQTENENGSNITIHVNVPLSKSRLEQLKEEIQEDPTLPKVIKLIQEGWPNSKEELPLDVQAYFSFKEELGYYEGLVVKGGQLVIPKSFQSIILREIHRSHKGVESCLRIARENVFWPKISQDISNYVKACSICQAIQKDKPMEILTVEPVPNRPWQIVATDLFSLNQKDYLVIADSYSGFFDFVCLKSTTTSMAINAIKRWFATFGIPDQLNSDGGPQFTSQEFQIFMNQWNIKHRISSPHFARSNGLAERYVQEGKILLKKCIKENSDIYLALLNNRNTPRGNIGSPAQRLMGRKTKSLLPCPPHGLQPKIIDPAEVSKALNKWQTEHKATADKGKTPNQIFEVGQKVLWRRAPRDWTPAEVIDKHPVSNSYIIQTPEGIRYRRNSWFLRQNHTSSNVPATDNASSQELNMQDLNNQGDQQRVSAEETLPTKLPSHRTASGRLIKPPRRLDL
ncbi:uncharacterized protein K02A2.6-like isoform X2 [Chrysoperla carnea]|uniref:uncharacterized protein K02A2.6-like n=2 Tax=Chrysoperla carnea TaxID=189513 RepID=UPI001D081CB4|nr:uncharacterized protein K02A2.6-like [Chrysoperla carnea]XP_044733987.1 uncharacterized protein K02A2.6-like [Chrysoperla carnea]XP_044735045.1 uncharacterized protein K02A2.6-like isoform X2 [Chrysoperla carnea]